jgi:Methyltransferase domain
MKIKPRIKGPIFIGRSYAEYLKMFGLKEKQLRNINILDCAAGASSFTAYMTRKGNDVTAVDILYDQRADFLERRCKKHLKILLEALREMDGHFIWSFFQDLDDLEKERIEACLEFGQDYRKYKGKKYIKANLTELPFEDNTFQLVLCSHLLFIYDHRLSYTFHQNSIQEMLRVSSDELRIYPLVKHKGKKSPFMERILEELGEKVDVDIIKVDYEFRRGGNEVMKINK